MAVLLPEKTNCTPVPFFSGKRRGLFPLLPALLCALAGALLMPKTNLFPYSFKSGRIWTYPDFFAPFDVTLMPNDSVPDAVSKLPVTPFYVINPEIARQQKGIVADLIKEQVKISSQDAQYEDLVSNPGAYKNYAVRLLDYLYKRGIVQARPENSDFVVLVGQSSRPIPVDSLLLVDDAVGIITDSLPFSPLRQPELLLPILEKVLVPNAFFSDSLTAADRGHVQNPEIKQISYKKGDLVIRYNEEVTPAVAQVLTETAIRYDKCSNWKILSGYLLYSLLAYLSLLGWIYYFKSQVYGDQNKMLLMLVTILGIQFLIAVCFMVGIVVPFLLPLFLLPLMLRPYFGLRTSLVIWSVPVMLTGFSISWGVLWISMQIVGAGAALMMNDQVESWKERLQALCAIFAGQTLIWTAFLLADKLPDALKSADVIVFLAISVLLSISRSVMVRFSQPGG
jgi:hypothetical protein